MLIQPKPGETFWLTYENGKYVVTFAEPSKVPRIFHGLYDPPDSLPRFMNPAGGTETMSTLEAITLEEAEKSQLTEALASDLRNAHNGLQGMNGSLFQNAAAQMLGRRGIFGLDLNSTHLTVGGPNDGQLHYRRAMVTRPSLMCLVQQNDAGRITGYIIGENVEARRLFPDSQYAIEHRSGAAAT